MDSLKKELLKTETKDKSLSKGEESKTHQDGNADKGIPAKK